MLVRKPKEFERVAREWASLYAGAPRKQTGESSGGATHESLRLQEIKQKEDQEQEDLAKYVYCLHCFLPNDILYSPLAGTRDTTRI